MPKMQALRAFTSRYEGRVRRDQEFETSDDRADHLERFRWAKRLEPKRRRRRRRQAEYETQDVQPQETKGAEAPEQSDFYEVERYNTGGGGWYRLPDGKTIQGRDEALAHLLTLENPGDG